MALLFVNDPWECARYCQLPEPEDYFSLVPRQLQRLLRTPSLLQGQQQQLIGEPRNTVSLAGDCFKADLDVQQFKPEEISVRVDEQKGVVTVEGKHEEQRDEHGFISRHFVRRYVLPQGHDVAKLESRLSSDGVLTISAPKIQEGGQGARQIQVVQTGQPSKPVENKQVEEDKKED